MVSAMHRLVALSQSYLGAGVESRGGGGEEGRGCLLIELDSHQKADEVDEQVATGLI